MAIRAIVLDYDGTILDSFVSVSRISAHVKLFCFRYLKPCYFLLEILEILLGLRWPLHTASIACMRWAREKEILVGIATDRSLLGLTRSAHRSRLEMRLLDFVRVRTSILDAWVTNTISPVLFRSRGKKDERHSMHMLVEWLKAQDVSPSQVLLVGDDECDHHAAARQGFLFLKVNRRRPDFGPVYRLIEETVRSASGE